jgi:glycosyltransferase involved in cell wall biosynthesis
LESAQWRSHPDTLHDRGLSTDGTTAYLDQIQQQYPDHITLYRPPTGKFWDGKREMVNAPLAEIHESCLLWQVDVDELWTIEQLIAARDLFLQHPHKTAAYYWCWYFVGEALMINSRNCYAENPAQEWLRTWRYEPGDRWAAHEPPRLVRSNGEDVAAIDPLGHDETEAAQLVFQHFAYVTPDQLRFKQEYYGYTDALACWAALQQQTRFPLRLRQYFPWVRDFTTVDRAEACGVVPIAHRSGNQWQFRTSDHLQPPPIELPKPLIAIDGVFFQLHKTGIARLWQSLLEAWAETEFRHHLVLLDRGGTAPEVPGIRTVVIDRYRDSEIDRALLQEVCDELGADLFISTYFTTPQTTPSVLIVHDMIPEVMGEGANHPIVRDKRRAIEYASDYVAISHNTARDLQKFFPQVSSVNVAHCGVTETFRPSSAEAIAQFRSRYGISKPYFLVTSADNPSPYKNNRLFFEAFAQLASKTGFDVVCTVLAPNLPDDWRDRTVGSTVHLLRLTDAELALAYAGAIALIYPSRYEGFGMPVLEAMACGCPVITCANSSIPEVADQAALYVAENDAIALADALCEVQKPTVRSRLIAAGLERSQRFSWSQMAETVRSTLIEATLPSLDRPIALAVFPDWQQPEALLYEALGTAIAALMTHPDQELLTLLVDASQIPQILIRIWCWAIWSCR